MQPAQPAEAAKPEAPAQPPPAEPATESQTVDEEAGLADGKFIKVLFRVSRCLQFDPAYACPLPFPAAPMHCLGVFYLPPQSGGWQDCTHVPWRGAASYHVRAKAMHGLPRPRAAHS
jgi:hypothetical protein